FNHRPRCPSPGTKGRSPHSAISAGKRGSSGIGSREAVTACQRGNVPIQGRGGYAEAPSLPNPPSRCRGLGSPTGAGPQPRAPLKPTSASPCCFPLVGHVRPLIRHIAPFLVSDDVHPRRLEPLGRSV